MSESKCGLTTSDLVKAMSIGHTVAYRLIVTKKLEHAGDAMNKIDE